MRTDEKRIKVDTLTDEGQESTVNAAFPKDLERVFNNTVAKIITYRKSQDQGIKVEVTDGTHTIRAELTQSRNGSATPVSKTQQKPEMQLNEESIKSALQEAKCDISRISVKEHSWGYFIKAGQRLGDEYDTWNKLIRGIGGKYIKYDAGNRDLTGGWRIELE